MALDDDDYAMLKSIRDEVRRLANLVEEVTEAIGEVANAIRGSR